MKIIRRIFLLTFACLLAGTAQADTKSRAMLDALTARLGTSAYEVRFTANMSEEFDDVPGRIVVSGSKFYVEVSGAEMFYDGKLLQTYNNAMNELVLETPDPRDNTLLSNPSVFFRLSDADFNHIYKGDITVNGRTLNEVVLTARTPGAGYTSITLRIDPATKLPVSVITLLDGISAPVEIAIDKITTNIPTTPSMFSFDKNKHKGVEVIDLR